MFTSGNNLEEKIQKLVENFNTLKKDNSSLLEDIENRDVEQKKHIEKIQQLMESLNLLNSNLDDLKRENNVLKNENSDLKSKLDGLEKNTESAVSKIDFILDQMNEL